MRWKLGATTRRRLRRREEGEEEEEAVVVVVVVMMKEEEDELGSRARKRRRDVKTSICPTHSSLNCTPISSFDAERDVCGLSVCYKA
jgi:hypothetical protein